MNSKPTKVISPLMMISSLSNTYPKKRLFEFSLIRKVRAGDNKQTKGTNWSLTVLDFINSPKLYNPSRGP